MPSLTQHFLNHALKRVDGVVRLTTNGRFYTYYSLSEAELIDGDLPDEAEYMRFAAAKGHPKTNEPDWGSYRIVPENHPTQALETGLIDYDPAQCQYHYHVWPDGLACHYETRGDPWPVAGETLSEFYDRITTHLSPTWDRPYRDRETYTYLRGVTP